MDLSTYYEEFRSTCAVANAVMCLAIFSVLFIGIRSLFDKKETIFQKVINCILLIAIISVVCIYYFQGPFLAKKDISQQTIFHYTGNFKITKVSKGIYNNAIFTINGEEIQLKYFDDESYDYEKIKIGEFKGEIVYAKHLAQILYINTGETQRDGSPMLTDN